MENLILMKQSLTENLNRIVDSIIKLRERMKKQER